MVENLHKSNANQTECSPHEEHLALQIRALLIDHVRSRICDGPVEQPVRRGGHTQALRTGFEREQLSSDDPCDWSPGAGEEEDVDAYECDRGALSGEVGGSGDGAGDGYDIWRIC